MSESENSGTRILLGVTGGVAAYKSPELVRRLREKGAQVQVVMTPGACKFVSPLTFQAVSGRRVRDDLWDEGAEAAMGHIELARWADLVLIAPATAHFMASLTAGLADGLLSTLCLATQAPVVLAPAMNQGMWSHPAVQANLRVLEQRGVRCLGPADGDQACGEDGPGRMLEPEDIVGAVLSEPATLGFESLKGLRTVITAGPTREPIDPVRYITNRSSGKMGFALAAAARRAGAEVILVSGPVSIATPPGVRRVDVETAEEMYAHVPPVDRRGERFHWLRGGIGLQAGCRRRTEDQAERADDASGTGPIAGYAGQRGQAAGPSVHRGVCRGNAGCGGECAAQDGRERIGHDRRQPGGSGLRDSIVKPTR